MRRYALTIAYDGTDFNGWQKQAAESVDEAAAELRSVQHVVERAVIETVREPIELLGASRTDSGVHALAQMGAFSTTDERRGPTDDRLALAINSRLPDDVLVRACVPANPKFHPVRPCVAKVYRYTLHTARDKPIWNRRFVHHVYVPLDEAPMREAAGAIAGRHDFAAFASAHHGRASTVRTVHACEVSRLDDDTLAIDVSGDGFLYNMVRIIAGTLVEVGKGKKAVEDVGRALESGDRRLAGPTMPAQGLRLEWIRYPEESFDLHAPDVPVPRRAWQELLEADPKEPAE
ncbi:MAG: tRNA pseudouridine(38-40) synthase TruA [Phycisphaerales bacterium]|nr:tRNA pseudouridine(38-40) synthase TruA [Phycisphaerales bacterium]